MRYNDCRSNIKERKGYRFDSRKDVGIPFVEHFNDLADGFQLGIKPLEFLQTVGSSSYIRYHWLF